MAARTLAVVLLIALAGCGQSGDLFLPEEAPAEAVATPPAPEDSENTEDDDEETPAG
ncbi:MAG: lipoprotein [Pseudomonadota bacterium]